MIRLRAPVWLALAGAELRSAPGFAAIFALSLALGLTGFIAVDGLRLALAEHVARGAQSLMGGDLSLVAERPITEAEEALVRTTLPPGTGLRRELAFVTMASRVEQGRDGRLVEVRAVDAAYPLLSGLVLKIAGPVAPGDAGRLQVAPGHRARAWIQPDVAEGLGVGIGDGIRIGDREVEVADLITYDPAVVAIGLQMAPRVVVVRDALAEKSWLTKGSRVTHTLLAKLPDATGGTSSNGAISDSELTDWTEALKARLVDSDIKVRSRQSASRDLGRALSSFSSFLALTAMVALFLAAVGGIYLFRSYLERRVRDYAIISVLGPGGQPAVLAYGATLTLLGLLASVLAVAMGLGLLQLAPSAFGSSWPTGLKASLPLATVMKALLAGPFTSLLTAAPLLRRLGQIRPSLLLREGPLPNLPLRSTDASTWLPALLAYVLLAVLTARSLPLAAGFLGVFLGAALVTLGLAVAVVRLIGLGADLAREPLILRLTALSLFRHRASTVLCITAVGVAATLVSLPLGLRTLLRADLARDDGATLPSLFLFDIQPEQAEALRDALGRAGAAWLSASPLVRARLVAINGSVPEDELRRRGLLDGGAKGRRKDSDDDDGPLRELRRGLNLSYRDGLSPSERLVEGEPLPRALAPGATGMLSVEERYARRLGLRLGDHLRFDVQGTSVEGVIHNLRQVRWTSFQPNFFLQFQPGVLEEAPHTLVAALPPLPAEGRRNILNLLSRDYPNVSAIDVRATIDRILGLIGQIERALGVMAILSLATGWVVVFAIASHEARRQRRESALLGILGASELSRLVMESSRLTGIGLAAGAIGAALGMGASLGIGRYLFQVDNLTIDMSNLAIAVLLPAAALMVGGLVFGRASARQSPKSLLQGA